jgi:hypothetical protein
MGDTRTERGERELGKELRLLAHGVDSAGHRGSSWEGHAHNFVHPCINKLSYT